VMAPDEIETMIMTAVDGYAAAKVRGEDGDEWRRVIVSSLRLLAVANRQDGQHEAIMAATVPGGGHA